MTTIKTEKEIEILREGGKILANIIKKIISEIKPGITTGQLEDLACSLIKKAGGRPSFKEYKTKEDNKPFPTALCISINDEVVHVPATPSRRLNAGDIVGIDLGIEYPRPSFEKLERGKPFDFNKPADSVGKSIKGYYTDMAVTVSVGKISKEAKKLIKATKKSLDLAIKKIKPGNTLNDIGKTIEQFIERQGFSVVRDLVGHGVGYDVHEDPQIPNFAIEGNKFDNIILKPGMVLAIEPMVNAGSYEIKNAPDGFSIKTADGSLSAHFEHTIIVTEDGCEIATKL